MTQPRNQTNRRAPESWHPETQLVRAGAIRSDFGEVSEALALSAAFVNRPSNNDPGPNDATPGYVYSRCGNPTVTMFEQRLAAIEGAEACRATATGMAAVFAALMSQLRYGDHVVAARSLFGSCHYVLAELLPRYGIQTTFVDGHALAQWRAALQPRTRCVFFETPSNPTLVLVDIQAVAKLAHQAGAVVIVDNVMATPGGQRPLQLGADIVVYSATKHIDGQGRCLGGAVLGSNAFCSGPLGTFLMHTGPALSPFNAWVLLKGLETLAVRVDRQSATAASLAGWLRVQPAIETVYYPGTADHPQASLARAQMRHGGTVMSFTLKSGAAAVAGFLSSLRLIDVASNLGDAKTLITHPATTTHASLPAAERGRLGIGDNLLRLSVGLEHISDLERDLAGALTATAPCPAAKALSELVEVE